MPERVAETCLAVKVAIPVIFDGVVCTAWQEFGDRGPPVAKLAVLRNDHPLLHHERAHVKVRRCVLAATRRGKVQCQKHVRQRKSEANMCRDTGEG